MLSPKYNSNFAIDEKILGMFDAYQKTYLSVDFVVDQDEEIKFPVEFLII